MKHSEKRQQLVRAIQEYISQEGWSPADFFHHISEKGADISESTARRIAKADPATENFSLDVLQRVSSALFGVNDKPIPAAEIDSAELAEREALRAVNALTDAALQDALGKIASLESRLEEAETKILKLVELAAFRKSQMIEKDRQIERLWSFVDRGWQSPE